MSALGQGCLKNLVNTLNHIYLYLLPIRRPVPSTDQAIPSCLYFRIS